MKEISKKSIAGQTTELLILGDGRILVHNLTPEMASLLIKLNPDDTTMRHRAESEFESASCNVALHQPSL